MFLGKETVFFVKKLAFRNEMRLGALIDLTHMAWLSVRIEDDLCLLPSKQQTKLSMLIRNICYD